MSAYIEEWTVEWDAVSGKWALCKCVCEAANGDSVTTVQGLYAFRDDAVQAAPERVRRDLDPGMLADARARAEAANFGGSDF